MIRFEFAVKVSLRMLDLLIIVVMVAITVSLAGSLYFLVRDRGATQRTVTALSVRVGLAIVLLALLAIGFITRFMIPGN